MDDSNLEQGAGYTILIKHSRESSREAGDQSSGAEEQDTAECTSDGRILLERYGDAQAVNRRIDALGRFKTLVRTNLNRQLGNRELKADAKGTLYYEVFWGGFSV